MDNGYGEYAKDQIKTNLSALARDFVVPYDLRQRFKG
jgi:hypothetical protein